ncbi:hypothetical protein HDU97_000558 [Phlyctochytrium planicorne]|nr:hypothetical protein HDU97_000558 [Phlyctochytrium planicorne]
MRRWKNQATHSYGIYLMNVPLVKPDESLCQFTLRNENIRLVQMVAAWGFAALVVWFFIMFWFFFGSRGKNKGTVDSSISAWQRRLEFLCFGKRSPFSDSKDVLKDIAQEIGLLFHDFDWAPSDIVLGLILIKREQKRLTEVLQARKILMDREKIRAAASGRIPYIVSPASGSFTPSSPGVLPDSASIISGASLPKTYHRFQHYLNHNLHHQHLGNTPTTPNLLNAQIVLHTPQQRAPPTLVRSHSVPSPTTWSISGSLGQSPMAGLATLASATSSNFPPKQRHRSSITSANPTTSQPQTNDTSIPQPTTFPRSSKSSLNNSGTQTQPRMSALGLSSHSLRASQDSPEFLGSTNNGSGTAVGAPFKTTRAALQCSGPITYNQHALQTRKGSQGAADLATLAQERNAGWTRSADDISKPPKLSEDLDVSASLKDLSEDTKRKRKLATGSRKGSLTSISSSLKSNPTISNDPAALQIPAENDMYTNARILSPLQEVEGGEISCRDIAALDKDIKDLPKKIDKVAESQSCQNDQMVHLPESKDVEISESRECKNPTMLAKDSALQRMEQDAVDISQISVVVEAEAFAPNSENLEKSTDNPENPKVSFVISPPPDMPSPSISPDTQSLPSPQTLQFPFKNDLEMKMSESPISSSSSSQASSKEEHKLHQLREVTLADTLESTPTSALPKMSEEKGTAAEEIVNCGSLLPVSSPPPVPSPSVGFASKRSLFFRNPSSMGSPNSPAMPSATSSTPGMSPGFPGRPSWSSRPGTATSATSSSRSPSKFSPWQSRNPRRAHHRSAKSFDRLKMNGNVTGSILREDIDDILHYARFAEVVYAPDEVNNFFDTKRLLRHNPSNQLFLSPYIIVYDPDMDAIIIAIRGTFSIADVLVDLKFDLAEFEIPELDADDAAANRPREVHWAHSGMLRTAKNIVEDIEKEQILKSVLTDRASEYFGCSLVVTGHSLGAGVAALVASLLRSNYPTACCYAYEPPGCLLSARAAQHFESFCTSVVMGDDIVPRTSRNSMEFLKADLARLIANCDAPKWRVFQSVFGEKRKRYGKRKKLCSNTAQEGEKDDDESGKETDVEKGKREAPGTSVASPKKSVGFEDPEKGNVPNLKMPKNPKDIIDILMSKKGNTPEQEEILKRAVEHFIAHDPAFTIERVLQFTPMFVPGRILYIEKLRRPPQTLQNTIGAAFNNAGGKIIGGLRDGAEGIKDAFTGGKSNEIRLSSVRRRVGSMDNLDIGGAKAKRGMSISLNELRQDRERLRSIHERPTRSSVDILSPESGGEANVRSGNRESVDIGRQSARNPSISDAPRKKSKAFQWRHSRRLSADDVAFQKQPMFHAKSAPDMTSDFEVSKVSLSADEAERGDSSRRASSIGRGRRPKMLKKPRKSMVERSKSVTRIGASNFSLDLERRPQSTTLHPELAHREPSARFNKSVDDILVVGRKNTAPAPLEFIHHHNPQRLQTVSFRHGSVHNISAANAPRLIASASPALPISVAINHPEQSAVPIPSTRKNPLAAMSLRSLNIGGSASTASTPSAKSAPTTPMSAANTSSPPFSPISPPPPMPIPMHTSVSKRPMVRQGSNAFPVSRPAAQEPEMMPLPTATATPNPEPFMIAKESTPSPNPSTISGTTAAHSTSMAIKSASNAPASFEADSSRPDANAAPSTSVALATAHEVRVTITTPDAVTPTSIAVGPLGTPLSAGSAMQSPSAPIELSKPQYPANYAVKKGGVPTTGALRRSGKYHYIPRWAKKEEFCEIVISRSMMVDHSPFALLREFQEAPEGSILGVMQKKPAQNEGENSEDADLRWLNGPSEHMAYGYHPSFLHPCHIGSEMQRRRTDSMVSEGSLINMYNYPSLSRSEFSINLVRSKRNSFTSSHTSSLQRHIGQQGSSSFSISGSSPGSSIEFGLSGSSSSGYSRDAKHHLEPIITRPPNDEIRAPSQARVRQHDGRYHHDNGFSYQQKRDLDPILVSYREMVAKMEASEGINMTDSLASPADSQVQHGTLDYDRSAPMAITSFEYFAQVWAYATSSLWSKAASAGESTADESSIIVMPSSRTSSLLFTSGSHAADTLDRLDPFDGGSVTRSAAATVVSFDDHTIYSPTKSESDTIKPDGIATEYKAVNSKSSSLLSPEPKFSDLEAILDRLPTSRLDDQRCDLAAIMARRKAVAAAAALAAAKSQADDDASTIVKKDEWLDEDASRRGKIDEDSRPMFRPATNLTPKDSMLVRVLKRSIGMGKKA